MLQNVTKCYIFQGFGYFPYNSGVVLERNVFWLEELYCESGTRTVAGARMAKFSWVKECRRPGTSWTRRYDGALRLSQNKDHLSNKQGTAY